MQANDVAGVGLGDIDAGAGLLQVDLLHQVDQAFQWPQPAPYDKAVDEHRRQDCGDDQQHLVAGAITSVELCGRDRRGDGRAQQKCVDGEDLSKK